MNITELYSLLNQQAHKGSCLFRKYSAAIVKENEIIGIGFATTPNGKRCLDCQRKEMIEKYGNISEFFDKCKVVHAEIAAILNCQVSRKLEGSSLYLLGILCDGEEVYQSAFPCEDCMKVIRYVGIKSVCVFQNENSVLCYEVER